MREVRVLVNAGCSQDVVAHCIAVSMAALSIAERVKVNVDRELVRQGGLFHDIGRARTHGIEHAVAGVEIARQLGFSDRLISIIERHIGAGITAFEAERLGLPKKDYLPLTPEEKIVSYADNLMSGVQEMPFYEALDRFKSILGPDHEGVELFMKQHHEIRSWMKQAQMPVNRRQTMVAVPHQRSAERVIMNDKKNNMDAEDFDIEPLKKSKIDKVVPVKLTGKSRFKFRCHKGVKCFTACCSNINIVLPPYDLLRLRKRLGMTTEDFINKYCEIEILAKTLLPVITLKMQNDEKKSCPFVTSDGCTVYEDRPNTCRYYPVGMATLRKKDAEGGKDEFYFMIKEDHCKGFEEDKDWTIDEWRKDQEADLYDDMNRGWMEILIKKKSFGEREFPEIKNQMFFMVSTNTDYFREFVFGSSFLETYDIPRERIEKVQTDDTELLKLGYEWLRSAMFAEETLKLKEGVAEARKDRADAVLRKVYGGKDKEQA